VNHPKAAEKSLADVIRVISEALNLPEFRKPGAARFFEQSKLLPPGRKA
jgi:hypothetical protein